MNPGRVRQSGNPPGRGGGSVSPRLPDPVRHGPEGTNRGPWRRKPCVPPAPGRPSRSRPIPIVLIYVVDWDDSAGEPVGPIDYQFTPGGGLLRHATVGPPGRVHPRGYPHTCRDRGQVNVTVPDGWELNDPLRPAWLLNHRGGRPERLEAAGVYLRAARGSSGFSLAGGPAPGGMTGPFA